MTRTDLPTVRTDDLADYGPAMRALPNDRMRGFVSALVQGVPSGSAAKLAGYRKRHTNPGRLTQDPRVQAALLEESMKVLRTDGVLCIRYLREIAGDQTQKAADRLKAIEMTLSRSGFASTTQHNVTVTQKSDGQLKQELLAMADELGLDAAAKQKLIGGPVVDAEFVEVKPLPGENDPAYRAAKQKFRSERLAREAEVQTPTDDVSEDVPTHHFNTEGTPEL